MHKKLVYYTRFTRAMHQTIIFVIFEIYNIYLLHLNRKLLVNCPKCLLSRPDILFYRNIVICTHRYRITYVRVLIQVYSQNNERYMQVIRPCSSLVSTTLNMNACTSITLHIHVFFSSTSLFMTLMYSTQASLEYMYSTISETLITDTCVFPAEYSHGGYHIIQHLRSLNRASFWQILVQWLHIFLTLC